MKSTKAGAPITKFTAALAATLRNEMNDLLTPVAKKYGIDVVVGNASYSDTNIKFKLETLVKDAQQIESRQNYVQFASLYDLETKWLDKTFVHQSGKTLQIVGLTSGRKPKVLLNDVNGKPGYVLPTEFVKAYMSADPAAARKQLMAEKNAERRTEWKRDLSFGHFDGEYPKYGTKFKHQGETYTVIGSRRSKHQPIVCENTEGKVLCFPLATVKAAA